MRSDHVFLNFSLRIFFWLCCLFFIGETRTYAYVIDGSRILRLSAIEIGRADTLLVEQNLTTYSFDKGTHLTKATEKIRYVFPNIFRIDQTTDDVTRFFLSQNDRSIAVVNNQADPQAESELDLYHYLLLQHRSEGLINLLEAYGIDTTISSLGKFEKKPAYVIGAQYPDENQSQLWVDKESFLPVRWLLVALSRTGASGEDLLEEDPSMTDPSQTDFYQEDSSEAGDVSQMDSSKDTTTLDYLEFRFSLWRPFDRLQYPMRITILQNGVLVREIRVNDVKMNSVFDKTLMNIDRQQVLFPAAKPQKIEEREDEETDDIQKTIDNFKKKFEQN